MFELTTMHVPFLPKIHPCLIGAWASLHAWNIYATFFASLGVETSRLTGRRKNGGAGGASWVILSILSMIYTHKMIRIHI